MVVAIGAHTKKYSLRNPPIGSFQDGNETASRRAKRISARPRTSRALLEPRMNAPHGTYLRRQTRHPVLANHRNSDVHRWYYDDVDCLNDPIVEISLVPRLNS